MNTNKVRKEFKRILDNTTIPSNLSDDEQMQRYNIWNNLLSANLPTKLYRYRSFSTLSLEAFYYDQVWVTIGSKMNDGYDARMYFNWTSVETAIESEFSDDRLEALYQQIVSIDTPIKQMLSQYLNARGYRGEITSMIDNPFIADAKTLRDMAMNQRAGILRDIMSAAQSSIKFACFSEVIQSPDMWGQYANSEEGFALQYDFKNELDSDGVKSWQTYPVIYQKNRFQIPDDYIRYLFRFRLPYMLCNLMGRQDLYGWISSLMPCSNPCPDQSMVTKIMLHKSLEWKTEREWRVICNSKDRAFQAAEYSYFTKKPIALYLGRRMKLNDRNILIDIAKGKGLPVFDMIIDDDSPKYQLKTVRCRA